MTAVLSAALLAVPSAAQKAEKMAVLSAALLAVRLASSMELMMVR